MVSKNKPLVSIIIPVHNAEKYIERCLDSVAAQKYSNLETIVVLDNCDDASELIVSNFDKINDIKVIKKVCGTPGKARNAGIDNASGEYILFLDADDLLYIGAVESLVDAAIKNDSDIVIGNHTINNEGKQPRKSEKNYNSHDAIIDLLYHKIPPAPWAKLFRFSTVKECRFPDYMVAEDYYYNYLCFKKAKNITKISNYCYLYTENHSSIMNKPFTSKRMDGLTAVQDLEKLAAKDKEPEDIMQGIQCGYFFHALDNLNMITKANKKEFSTEYKQLKKYLKQYAKCVLNSPNATDRQKRYAKLAAINPEVMLKTFKVIQNINK